MTYSISNSFSATNAYLTQQSIQTKSISSDFDSKPVSDLKPNSNSVTLSAIGQQMAAQDKVWSTLSHAELKGIYDRSWDKLTQLDDAFRAMGMVAFDSDIPAKGTQEQIASATEMRDYMVSLHTLPQGKIANPYAGYSREALTSIIYNESGTYTKSDTYAAVAEQQRQDFLHFSALFASSTSNPDHRQMYIGILDFHSKLSPVEQSAYAPDYRQLIGECLRQEETLFGALSESDKKTATNEQGGTLNEDPKKADEPPKKKTLFDILIESDIKKAITANGNISIASILKRDEPVWKQLVELTSKLSSLLANNSPDALDKKLHPNT